MDMIRAALIIGGAIVMLGGAILLAGAIQNLPPTTVAELIFRLVCWGFGILLLIDGHRMIRNGRRH
ncbi:MAG: hypothetical protein AAGG53_12730 [Cyanobacteria bacterium P01_H01_bin.152]